MLGNVASAETCEWFRCLAFFRECAATIDSFFWWRNYFFHSQATNDAIYSLLAYLCNERTQSHIGIPKLFETENWIQRLCDRKLSKKSFNFNNKFVQHRKMKIKQSPREKLAVRFRTPYQPSTQQHTAFFMLGGPPWGMFFFQSWKMLCVVVWGGWYPIRNDKCIKHDPWAVYTTRSAIPVEWGVGGTTVIRAQPSPYINTGTLGPHHVLATFYRFCM